MQESFRPIQKKELKKILKREEVSGLWEAPLKEGHLILQVPTLYGELH
tara:strand:+ start:126 stop:269 length:144 start_codon:yes stop_codon:yes gene_type:complete